eukprot:3328027-Pleurochrysis_carterae.AAC.1
MVALPTVYKEGFGRAPDQMRTEWYRAAVKPDLGRTVSFVVHDRSAALKPGSIESVADIRLCRNPANALYSAHREFLPWRTLAERLPTPIIDQPLVPPPTIHAPIS